MNTIRFVGPNAFLIKEDRGKEISMEPIESILPYLNDYVELEEGTLFRHVWAYIEKDAEILGIIFSGAMGHFPIGDFIKQSKKPGKAPDFEEPDDPQGYMAFLELGWCAEADCYDESDKYSFHCGVDFRGIGPQYDSYSGSKTEEGGWGLSFVPINDMMNYPLKLDTDFPLRVTNMKKRGSYESIAYNCSKEFTIYDVIHGILFEITFCGSPEEQQSKLAELDQTIAEAKEAIREGRDDYFHSLDDLLDEIDDKE